MSRRARMNVYFEPALLDQVEALALRRRVSKSAVVEAAVASFLSGDTTERMEAALSRRLDRLGRQLEGLEEDIVILAEAQALFIRFWMTVTPPLPEAARDAARATGAERFEGFLETLARRLAKGDRFLRDVVRDQPGEQVETVGPSDEDAL